MLRILASRTLTQVFPGASAWIAVMIFTMALRCGWHKPFAGNAMRGMQC